MSFLEIIIIALGLAMDAFAVSVSAGLSSIKFTIKKAVIIGLYFGFFQALMPLIGYFLTSQFADKIDVFDHWIVFGLLSIIGLKMIIEALSKKGCKDRRCPKEICIDRKCPKEVKEFSFGVKKLLPLAIATSIDALAMGVPFALLNVNLILATASIGIITFALSMTGLKIGNLFGSRFKSKAEFFGGAVLILMGVKILFEHMHLLWF